MNDGLATYRASLFTRSTEGLLQNYSTLLLLIFALGGAPPASLEGSYLARTLNGRPVPTDLRIPAASGDTRLFRLEQGLLRLSANGRFTLYYRYHHQLVPKGSKPVSTPVMSDSESGTYSVKGDRIVFSPLKKKGARSASALSATVEGEEIKATYLLHDASLRQPITLELRRDASFW